MTTILLARHGESDWNAEQRWQGHADRPLTELGRAQAAALAERLDGLRLAALYSSDLRRAQETAQAVAARHGLDVRVRRELREVDCGSWSGLCHADLDPADVERWRAGARGWEGGESYEELQVRMVAAVTSLGAAHAGEQFLVVSHGAAIRSVLAQAAGMNFHDYRRLHPSVENAGLSAVVVRDGRLVPADALDGPGRMIA